MKFRKKPVVITAVQLNMPLREEDFYTGFEWSPAATFPFIKRDDGTLLIPTLEGGMIANIGDWIIRGVHNEFYPCKPAIFEATYEEVE